VGNSYAKANEESGRNKHLNVDTNRLHNNADDHDDTTSHNAHAPTKDVGNVWNTGKGADRARGHDSIQKTALSIIGVVEG
jgi:hypothetical protein